MKFKLFEKEFDISKQTICIFILFITAILFFIGFNLNNSQDIVVTDAGKSNIPLSMTPTAIPTSMPSKENTKIKIYIVGCIKNPGIITIEKGRILDDLIKKAGGLTKDASSENINMVYQLNENMMIKILSKKELKNASNPQKQAGAGVEITMGSGNTTNISNSNSTEGSLININTATKEQLESLPEIGDSTAKKIIDYREKNGSFKSINDIKNVSGIGEKKFERIKDLICV
jgi:competence protein ComEA